MSKADRRFWEFVGERTKLPKKVEFKRCPISWGPEGALMCIREGCAWWVKEGEYGSCVVWHIGRRVQ